MACGAGPKWVGLRGGSDCGLGSLRLGSLCSRGSSVVLVGPGPLWPGEMVGISLDLRGCPLGGGSLVLGGGCPGWCRGMLFLSLLHGFLALGVGCAGPDADGAAGGLGEACWVLLVVWGGLGLAVCHAWVRLRMSGFRPSPGCCVSPSLVWRALLMRGE